MSCNKSNCVIALGLTIMDRCPECEKIERASERASEPIHCPRVCEPTPSVSHDGGKTWTRVDAQTCADSSAKQDIDDLDAVFFVSCIEDEGEHRRLMLLGPYDTHAEALRNVDHGRKLAEQDPKAHWYYFGTCSMAKETETKGVFGK